MYPNYSTWYITFNKTINNYPWLIHNSYDQFTIQKEFNKSCKEFNKSIKK